MVREHSTKRAALAECRTDVALAKALAALTPARMGYCGWPEGAPRLSPLEVQRTIVRGALVPSRGRIEARVECGEPSALCPDDGLLLAHQGEQGRDPFVLHAHPQEQISTRADNASLFDTRTSRP